MTKMDPVSLQNVCRMCPETGSNQKLLNVFDPKLSHLNMKEVIYTTTGVKICETDLVSKKICERCCNITQKMQQFKRDAVKHNIGLKMKCNKLLSSKGFIIPEIQLDVNHNQSSSSSEVPQKITKLTEEREPKSHSSADQLKMEPTVLLISGQVEEYFQKRNLNLTNYLDLPKASNKVQQTKSSNSSKAIERKVTPITIQRQKKGMYVCSFVKNKTNIEKRKEEYKNAAKIPKRDQEAKESNTTDSSLRNNMAITSEKPTILNKVIKPNVCIKNDKIINLLPNNLKGNKLIYSILSTNHFNGHTRSAEKMLQTTQPFKKDIEVIQDTCIIKGLRDQLHVFKIPVNVSRGPFSVDLQYNNPPNLKSRLSLLRGSPDMSARNKRK